MNWWIISMPDAGSFNQEWIPKTTYGIDSKQTNKKTKNMGSISRDFFTSKFFLNDFDVYPTLRITHQNKTLKKNKEFKIPIINSMWCIWIVTAYSSQTEERVGRKSKGLAFPNPLAWHPPTMILPVTEWISKRNQVKFSTVNFLVEVMGLVPTVWMSEPFSLPFYVK